MFPRSVCDKESKLSGFRLGSVDRCLSVQRFEPLGKLLPDLPLRYHTGEPVAKVFRRTVVAGSGTDGNTKGFRNFMLLVMAKIYETLCRSDVLETKDRVWRIGELTYRLRCISDCEFPATFPVIDDIYEYLDDPEPDKSWFEHRQQQSEWNNDFERYSTARHIFITKNHQPLLGFCPKVTQPGDLVYIIKGGLTPFILRPVSTGPNKKTFQLVGEAYVHGFMHGEAMEGNPQFEEITLI